MADPTGGSAAGETYVIYGGDWTSGSTIDLNSESANLTIYGDDFNDYSGISVSTGNINNDGYDDVIIGARNAYPAGGSYAGETYVIYGGDWTSGSTIDLNSESANLTIYGDDYQEYSGNGVSSGDINGDGYDDVIIGAFKGSYNSRYMCGKTYVINPIASGEIVKVETIRSKIRAVFTSNGNSSAVISSNIDTTEWHSVTVTKGSDLRLYIDGSLVATSSVDSTPLSGSMNFTLGALNNNGIILNYFDGIIDEVKISNIARSADWVNAQHISMNNTFVTYGSEEVGEEEVGAAYIFFGDPSISSSDINAANADVVFYGETAGGHLGWSVSDLGNVDSDTMDDIIIGAPDASDTGKAYIFYGRSSWNGTYNASEANVTISGETAGDNFGSSVSGAGDFDNSDYNDIIVGAYGYDANTGRAYIFLGDGSIPTSADNADQTMTGEATGDYFGFSVSGAGDVDNDGSDDVIIGAPFNDEGGSDAGRAYICSVDGSIFVSTNREVNGSITNFANAKSDSDGGAYATLSEKITAGSTLEETLRPNGAGDKNTWDTGSFTDVNDQSDGTYLESAAATWDEGLFATADPSGSGTLNFVRVYIRYQRSGGSPGTVDVRTHIKSGTTESTGTTLNPTTAWQDSYTEYAQNPDDSQDWEWSDITSIQIGADGQTAGGRKPRIAEVWLVINYTLTNHVMNIEFNATNVKSAELTTLQLNYSTDGSENFDVFAYNKTSSGWDDVGDLTSGSFTIANFTLNSTNHRLDNGVVSIMFVGQSESDDGTNSSFYIEYHKILSTNISIELNGENAGDNFGFSVANGSDLNNDGSFDDVIVGAPGYSGNMGSAYVFFGGGNMDGTANLTLTGDNPSDKFGYSVHGAGDVNNDGIPDVIVGAPYASNGTVTECGAFYIFHGGASMDSIPDYRNYGENAYDHLGWSVSFAGNIDGDLANDTMAGAPHFDAPSGDDAGKVYIFSTVVIPEFEQIVIPVTTMLLIFTVWRKKRKRAKKSPPQRENKKSKKGPNNNSKEIKRVKNEKKYK
jgi:hypothetical protein